MKIPRQISLKKAATIILISVLLTVIGSYYVFATAPSSTFTISPGIYPGAPSYTIWKEGSYFFAKDSNGKIAFSGDDIATVAQNVIDALPDGGKVVFKRGLYVFYSPLNITMQKAITISGETLFWGHQTEGKGTIFRKNFNGDLIRIFRAGSPNPQDSPMSVTIENLELDGARRKGYTGNGIYAYHVGSLRIRNCFIHSFDGCGIYLEFVMDVRIENCAIGGCDTSNQHTTTKISEGTWLPNNIGIYVNGGWVIWIVQNGIWHNKEEGIKLTTESMWLENVWIQSNNIVWNGYNDYGAGINITKVTGSNPLWWIHILDNVIDENGVYGIYAQGNLTDLWIVNNQFVGNGRFKGTNTPWAIYLRGESSTYKMAGIEIYRNTITDKWNTGQKSISFDYVDGIRIEHNNLGINFDESTYPEIGSNNLNVIIRFNTGYVTEDWGVATFTGDGSTDYFDIEYQLSTGASVWFVTLASYCGSDVHIMRVASITTGDSSYLRVYLSTAPEAASTVIFRWEVRAW